MTWIVKMVYKQQQQLYTVAKKEEKFYLKEIECENLNIKNLKPLLLLLEQVVVKEKQLILIVKNY